MVSATEFEAFWRAYPRKTGKGKARTSWEKAAKAYGDAGALLAKCLDTLSWQKQLPQWREEGGQFVPLPATWLNQERWDDEPFYNEMPAVNTQTKTGRTILAAQEFVARRRQSA